MIEVKGHLVLRFGERVGMIQGDTVFLLKELSGQDKRKIREQLETEERTIDFGTLGTIRQVNR